MIILLFYAFLKLFSIELFNALAGVSLELKKYWSELFSRPEHQIPVLDGVRSLAILLVVGLHSNIHILRDGLPAAKFAGLPPFQGGWVGVPLFFILSGYFIGGQLWKEFLRTGEIKVGQFILRRGLRVWPLYYFILVVSLLIFNSRSQQVWTNVFFVANYFGDNGPIRGAWSLSTEEQFYILIPSILFIFIRFFQFNSLQDFRKLLYVLLVIPMMTRAITWYSLTGFNFFDINLYMNSIYRPFHTHFDGLIVGLLIANIQIDKTFSPPYFLKKPYLFFAASLMFALALRLIDKVIFSYFSLAMAFGSFTWLLLNTKSFVTNLFSHKIFYFIAKVSFGVYLVHHLVLWALDDFGWFNSVVVNPEFHLVATYVGVFAISCGICSVTYIFIEAPCMEFRNRWLNSKRTSRHVVYSDIG